MQPRKSDTLSIRRVSVPAGLSRSSRYPPRCILPSAALSSPIYEEEGDGSKIETSGPGGMGEGIKVEDDDS